MVLIFIPVKSAKSELGISIDPSTFTLERKFGKTPFYGVINSDTLEFDLVRNDNHHFGGNKSSADIAKEHGCSVCITVHMGSSAFEKLRGHGIEILRGELNVPITDLVDKFNNNKLGKFDNPKEKHHH